MVANQTGVTVNVYTYKHESQYRRPLEPGQTFSEGWMFPITPDDDRVRRVEADDAGGHRLFCVDLKYQDLAKADWRIEIIREDRCK